MNPWTAGVDNCCGGTDEHYPNCPVFAANIVALRAQHDALAARVRTAEADASHYNRTVELLRLAEFRALAMEAERDSMRRERDTYRDIVLHGKGTP